MRYILGGPIHDANTVILLSLDDVTHDLDIGVEQSDHFCYLETLWDCQNIPAEMEVADFLQFVTERLDYDRMVQFSVTSAEDRYQEWLDAVSGIPGHTICSTERGEGTRRRTVYLCSFPVTPNFSLVEGN